MRAMSNALERIARALMLPAALGFACGSFAAARAQAPVASAAAAVAASEWAPDSCERPPRVRQPFRRMLVARQWRPAADTARAIRDRMIERPGLDSLSIACLLLDHVALGLQDAAAAQGLAGDLQRAMAIARREPGADSLFLTRALYTEAEWHRICGRLERADSLLLLSLAMQERRATLDPLEIAATLFGIAAGRQIRGLTSGLPYVERAIRINESRLGANDLSTNFLRYQFAGQLLANGDVARARVEGERAIAAIRTGLGEQHADLPRFTRALGQLALADGDFPGARRHFEETLRLTRSRTPVDSLALGRTYSVMSEMRNDLGDFEGALESARLSVELQRGRMPAGDPRHANAYLQLGRALAALGASDPANAALDTAFVLGTGDSSLASYGVLARAHAVRATGDTATALAWARRARALGQSSHEPLDAYQAEAARFHADCLVDAGRPKEVVRELGEALAVAAQRYGDSHPAITRMRETHARALVAAGDPRAAAAALAVAAQRRTDLLALARGFSDREALFVARRDGSGLDPLLALASAGKLDADQRAAAWAAVASVRGMLLEAMSARTRELRLAATPAATAALDSLAAARGELARSMVRATNNAVRPDSALRESRAAVQRWELRLADLAAGFTPLRAIEAPQLLSALAPHEALVSYAMHRSLGAGEPERRQLLAFVSRPGGGVEVRALGDAAPIEALVHRWRQAAAPGGTLRAARASGDSLRRRIWDPLEPLIAGAERVVIVPEGALHLVDLASLPAPRRGWLVDTGPAIARLSSERDLLAPTARVAGTPLVVGAPDFEDASRSPLAAAAFRGAAAHCQRFADVRFEPLPGARAESEEIMALLTARGLTPQWLTGAAASESAIKRSASGASALHLATHAFFLGEACGGAAGTRGVGRWVAASKPSARPAKPLRRDVYLPEQAGAPLEHPLRLAGLALAGANHRAEAGADREDGILTSEEIAALDLSSVGEVVLSGCDTGLGDIAVGEGVFGLQRAFRLAGAGGLVMSLWPVRDADARAWMAAYYRARGAGLLPADAVREASRARLAALRADRADEHPSRWSGFIAAAR